MNDVEKHYRKNLSDYKRIEERLTKINSLYQSSNLLKKKEMLLDSYVFALLSIQTPVPIHEDAWIQYMEGEGLESAFESVNYKYNKIKYLEYTKSRSFRTFEEILTEDDLDKKHRMLVDNFKGVGVIKSAFTLAMLGFTEKMCIDTNVMDYFEVERKDIYTGKVVGKYENQCEELLSQVNLEATPFMTQWILFNIQRMSNDRGFSRHTTYFGEMFGKFG